MKYFKGALLCASAIALSGAMAATAQEDEGERKLGTVTVTGSFIQGTPEDAALPVDVLTADDLRLQGNPSALDIIKSLPVSSGVLVGIPTSSTDARRALKGPAPSTFAVWVPRGRLCCWMASALRQTRSPSQATAQWTPTSFRLQLSAGLRS